MSIEQSSPSWTEAALELSKRDQALILSANIIDDQRNDDSVTALGNTRRSVAKWHNPTQEGSRFQLIEYTWQANPQAIQLDYALCEYRGTDKKPVTMFKYDTSPFQKMDKMNEKGKLKRCKKEEIEELLGYLKSAPSKQLVNNEIVDGVVDKIIEATELHEQSQPEKTKRKRTLALRVFQLLNRSSKNQTSTL